MAKKTKLLEKAIEKVRELPAEDRDTVAVAVLSMADETPVSLDDETRAAVNLPLAPVLLIRGFFQAGRLGGRRHQGEAHTASIASAPLALIVARLSEVQLTKSRLRQCTPGGFETFRSKLQPPQWLQILDKPHRW
jgi:hypothetical protein